MHILIACEESAVVRSAFTAAGHDAWSCDLLPSQKTGNHIRANVLSILDYGWDMMIAFPPCTYLSYAGSRWWKRGETYDEGRIAKMLDAVLFFQALLNAPIPRIAVENPRGVYLKFEQSTQVIQPCYFGDPMTKETHLWLRGVAPLIASHFITNPFINWTENGHRSAKQRSKTFPGIAAAMAAQWG